jgi:hypothetical protein
MRKRRGPLPVGVWFDGLTCLKASGKALACSRLGSPGFADRAGAGIVGSCGLPRVLGTLRSQAHPDVKQKRICVDRVERVFRQSCSFAHTTPNPSFPTQFWDRMAGIRTSSTSPGLWRHREVLKSLTRPGALNKARAQLGWDVRLETVLNHRLCCGFGSGAFLHLPVAPNFEGFWYIAAFSLTGRILQVCWFGRCWWINGIGDGWINIFDRSRRAEGFGCASLWALPGGFDSESAVFLRHANLAILLRRVA